MGPRKGPWTFLLLIIFWILKASQSFVVITDQSKAEGWILFDSQIELPPAPDFYPDSNVNANISQRFYHYRISKQKTQPWIHRIIKLNSDGQLMFRRNYAHKCQMSHIFPSTFLVYIDVIAKSALPNEDKQSEGVKANSPHDDIQPNNALPRQFYDYISFPITVILKESNECNQERISENQQQGIIPEKAESQGSQEGNELTGTTISRTVDDIYVSLPVKWKDRCFHASEKIGNVVNFLPASVRAQCVVKAHVMSDEFTWAVESSTNDIVLRRDWCLFEPYHTIQLELRLNCSSSEESRTSFLPESVMSWDQMAHLILHTSKLGGVGISSLSDVIHRIRREMRNQAPYFDQALFIAKVNEELPPPVVVFDLSLSLKGVGTSPLTYSMSALLDSRSEQFFDLDGKSGIVSTSRKLDREEMDVHYFKIVASTGGRTGTATLQIDVTDVNEFGPSFEQAVYAVSVRERTIVGSTVISVRATDKDKNGNIYYSILNQHDIDDTFRIDPNSGVITSNRVLDREQREEYSILVQATDLALASTAKIIITILDDNDNIPQWSQRSYNVTIPENIDVSSYPVIATVRATDLDEGVNSALRYSIIGGNTENIFNIDSLTGEVSLTKSLDYEATRRYRIIVRVVDNGNPPKSNTSEILVYVNDINDNPARFYSQIFQETVPENIPIQSSVLKISAFDADDGEHAKIIYRLAHRGNNFPFDIEPESGWIKTNRELDYEEQTHYEFEAIAGGESGGDEATATVVIQVSDLNDNDPRFDPKLYETQVSELQTIGSPVLIVRAKDRDHGSRLAYEIADGNVRSRFSITTQNGEGIITIAQPLDFKSEKKYVLTIRVKDEGDRLDLATVIIVVLPTNKHSPQFQNIPYSVKIFEDVKVGTNVITVKATIEGETDQIIYGFENLGDAPFMIDSTTGVITTTQLLDRETQPGYIVSVTARGIYGGGDITDVEIVLLDVNDETPVFEQDNYHAEIYEDIQIGTSILRVAATDADVNSVIRYSFSTFSDGDGAFSVDPVSGIIRTMKPIDREQTSRYEMIISASDGAATATSNLIVVILDINDNPPQFESDRIRLFIQENSAVGNVVGTISAFDPDEGQNAAVIFSIIGGPDANSFTLHAPQQPANSGTASADILTRIELDYESPNKKYDIIVRAASPPLRSDVQVEIWVVDVNDNAPMIRPQFHIILNNYKNHFSVAPVGVPVTDADINDKLHYSIVNGNKANLVYLNETTGLITLSPYLDTNVPLNAKMEVLISDGLNEVRSEMILHTRMITDDLLFNSITIQLSEMTTEAFLSPLFHHFQQAVAVILNVPKENIIIFSVEEEIEGTHGSLNVSLSARKPSSTSEEYFSPDYMKERIFLNRLTLSKLATVDVLPFSDDLCLQEPCLNFEECLVVLKFRNVSNFITTDTMLFRSVFPWQTFACRCPVGFTGLREHYFCDAEINLCFSSPCLNGGTCFQKERGYSCICPPGFTGASCGEESRVGGGLNCSRGEYVNELCELTARSFSRGSYLTFQGLKDRVRLHLEMSFATQQRNGLLLYNGRYNERFDFIALEIVNSTVRFSYSLGSNITVVETGKAVSDGQWHEVSVQYFNKTATVSVDNCDVIVSLENPDEFPPSKSCAGRRSQILEERCHLLTESCQRFLDLTGPLYIGGLPTTNSPYQIQTHDFLGCVKNVFINHKFLDLNNFVVEHSTTNGCPEKKSFCKSQPCKNLGRCNDGWGTYSCECRDGYGQKDCSEDAKPVWNLRDETSFVSFTPQLRQIQFPWYNSVSLRTLKKSGKLMTIKLSNNETLQIALDNGLIQYYYNEHSIPVTLPRVNDGKWHHIEAKWMTAEIWFSLDFGQFETTVPYEAKMQNLHVNQVLMGGSGSSISGCIQDVRVGSAKNYLRKTVSEKNTNEGCGLATVCVGAVCPQRSTCVEEGGKSKCQCDPGYQGVHCTPTCDLRPCKNNGTCILDLTIPRGYRCQCDERFYRGNNCEEVMELSCPSTWWGWPVCGPCSCPAEKHFSPECNKKNGQCKCREYHYEKEGICKDCQCYGAGSVSKNCDLTTGKCQCRSGVTGNRCDSCVNLFAEVTTKGCEVVRDGCPRAFASEIWWPRTAFDSASVHDCPNGAVGLATRDCNSPEGWLAADLFNCTSNSFISIVNIVSQLDSRDLSLTPLLSTKLAADLSKALNTSQKLYGNDVWISLRLLTHLITHETKQTGLNLSHRQDKNFIRNVVASVGKVTSKQYSVQWERLRRTYGSGSDTLLALMEKYLAHLVLNQEDTFTKPFEIISSNLVMGLDTVELTWDNEGRKNFEDLTVESSYDLYEVTSVTKRAVRFPKYDNIVMDPRRYPRQLKIVIPLDVLGLQDEKDMAGNAVVGFAEYYSLWDVMPKKFMSDVDRRFNSEIIASAPIVSLSILASRQGLVSGRQTSPIRLSYEIVGRYIDSSNPQCVVWQEPTGLKPLVTGIAPLIMDDSFSDDGGWTSRPCLTQVEEQFISKLGNVMTVNCTCWHLSTFAVLIENNDTQDIPRAGVVEDIVTYVSFVCALALIFGALIGLGLLQGPVPSTITNTIHKHLLLSIFFALLFYLVALKLRLILVTNDNLCRALAIGLHATWLAAFSWLFGSAIHLRRMFTEVRDVNHGSSLFYFALGYAFPLLCVALSLGVRAHHYGNRFFCWLSLYETIVWGMVGPILICVVATLLTFLIAVRAAFTLKDQVVDSGNMRTLLWMDLTLLPICGMVWALCLLGANERSPAWQFAIAIAVAVLSVYIALGYCILNKRVKDSFFYRTGALFRSRDAAAPQNASRSALAYRADLGVGGLSRDDPRKKDLFRTVRSGVSTASTTSRSTTKTSSSPYGYGATLPHYRVKYGDEVDRKHHPKRRKRSNSDDDGSSDGERTLELASSHSSDEDEATTVHGPVRSATLGMNGHRYPHYRLVPNGHGLNGSPHSPNNRHKLVSASLSTLHVPTTQTDPPPLPRLYSTHWTPNIFTPPTYREFSCNLRGDGIIGHGGILNGAAPSSGSDNEANIYKYPATEDGDDHSSQHSQSQGQPQSSSSYHPMYVQQKELNSLDLGHGHPEQAAFNQGVHHDQVNDLSGTASPNLSSFARISSPIDRRQYPVTYGIVSGPGRPKFESSPLQELPPHPPHLSSFHPPDTEISAIDEGVGQVNVGMEPVSGDEDAHHQPYPHQQQSYNPQLHQQQSQTYYHYDYPRQPSVQVVTPLSSTEEASGSGRARIINDPLRPTSSSSMNRPTLQFQTPNEDEDNSDAYSSIVAGVLV